MQKICIRTLIRKYWITTTEPWSTPPRAIHLIVGKPSRLPFIQSETMVSGACLKRKSCSKPTRNLVCPSRDPATKPGVHLQRHSLEATIFVSAWGRAIHRLNRDLETKPDGRPRGLSISFSFPATPSNSWHESFLIDLHFDSWIPCVLAPVGLRFESSQLSVE